MAPNTPVRAKVAQEAPTTVVPTVALTTAPSASFKAKQIKPSIDRLRPEILAKMHSKNSPTKSSVIPDWLIIPFRGVIKGKADKAAAFPKLLTLSQSGRGDRLCTYDHSSTFG